MKIKKKNIFFFFLGGGRVRGGGQGRCEQRSEVFVKNKKKMCGGVQVGGAGVGSGGGWMGGQGGCE